MRRYPFVDRRKEWNKERKIKKAAAVKACLVPKTKSVVKRENTRAKTPNNFKSTLFEIAPIMFVDESFKRIFAHAGVIGCAIIDREAGRVVQARGSKCITESNFIARVASLLTNTASFSLDKNDERGDHGNEDERGINTLPKCLRIRFDRNEVIIAPGDEFALVVIQECKR